MTDTYICPDCKRRCYTGTPHMCGPDSLAHVNFTPFVEAVRAYDAIRDGKAFAQDALRDAMTGPTSGGIARQLAPVVLDAIIAGTIPGVVWRSR